jgi:hypothetical protein
MRVIDGKGPITEDSVLLVNPKLQKKPIKEEAQ